MVPTLTQDGRALAVTGLDGPAAGLVRDALTVVSETRGGPLGYTREVIPLYREAGGVLHCGAGLKDKIAGVLTAAGVTPVVVHDPRHVGPQYEIDASPLEERGVQLRAGQWEVIRAVLGRDCGTVLAPTGYGKSFLIQLFCRLFPKARIAYLAYSSDLCEQMYEDLSKTLSGVGRVRGSKRKRGRVEVVNIDSAHHTGYDQDIIFGDEVDQLAAPRFMAQLGNFGHRRPCRAYAFTASFERADNRHRLLEAVFGPVVVEVDYREAQAAKMVVPIRVEWVRPAVSSDPGAGMDSGPHRERVCYWQHAERNDAVAERCRLFAPDDQVLVMVSKVEQAYQLKARLPGYEVCYAPSDSSAEMRDRLVGAGVLDPGEPEMTDRRREALREAFADYRLKKVIATGVWARGLNFRRLPHLVRADGGRDDRLTRQISGRLSRLADGKDRGLLVDFWDDWADHAVARSRARWETYEDLGFTQVRPPRRQTPRPGW